MALMLLYPERVYRPVGARWLESAVKANSGCKNNNNKAPQKHFVELENVTWPLVAARDNPQQEKIAEKNSF